MANNPGAVTVYLGSDLIAEMDRYLAAQVAGMDPAELLVAARKHQAPTRSSVMQEALKQFLARAHHA